MIKKEIKEPVLKYEDVVFNRNDRFDDDITVDNTLSDAETAVFDNMSDNETTLPENLSDAETEFYGSSDAKTIDYTSDIEFIKKIPKKWMKRKLRDKIKKETIESKAIKTS